VKGATPELGKAWKECRYLYVPCCASNHWFALQIDLEERTIFMFDSLKGHIRRVELEAYILPLQEIIPSLIKFHVTSEEEYNTEKFKFVKVKDVPQQMNG
jgi:Ulp1 family protease